ncbi:hypothetical protein pb186bvf_017928 [Paramecium bursaria]
MIPQQHVDQVYEFLSQSQDGPLDTLYKNFLKRVQDQPFNHCYILYQALCDNTLPQRIRFVAIYIINELFGKQVPNPFVLSDLNSSCTFERKFISNLLNKEQYGQVTVKQLMDDVDKHFDIRQEKQSYTLELRQTIPDPIGQSLLTLPSIDHFKYQGQTISGFSQDFLRVLPQIMISDPEWLDIGIVPDVHWDYHIEVSTSDIGYLKELIQKAGNVKLTLKEEQHIIDQANKEKKYILDCGININNFMNIVNFNPNIASFYIARLNQCGQSIQDYFDLLVKNKINVNILEVVHKLSQSIQLPQPFISFFVSKCLENCESKKDKDKNTQLQRQARIVSVFLKAIIKSKILDPKSLFAEIQAFCIEYSKISEAQTLFKMIRDQVEEKKQHQN